MFVILPQIKHEKNLISSSDLKQMADGARTMTYIMQNIRTNTQFDFSMSNKSANYTLSLITNLNRTMLQCFWKTTTFAHLFTDLVN